MSWKLKVYNKLVNEVGGIREKYNSYKQSENSSALKAYAYLGLMNFQYHVLHQKSVGELSLGKSDEKICISPHFSESSLADYGTVTEFVERLMPYEVISFDVFDTLILRPFKKPMDLFYFLDKDYNYPNLKKLRIEAEKNARLKKLKSAGHGEVSLKEIWEELSTTFDFNAQYGMDKEFSLEKEYCFANPFFVEVVKTLRAQKKKLIICSDMYLGESYIEELLLKCGYEGFDDYIVSSDYGKSKAEGSLYEVIKEKHGNNIVHVGDNPHSDVKMAGKHGVKSVYYGNVNSMGNKYRPSDMSPITASVYGGLVNSHLYNGLNKYNWEYEFGFIYGGLLVTGYTRYIHQYAKENNIDKLLFLARDGDVICKAYKLMYPEEADKCEYILWSRLAATRLCAAEFKEQFMARMVDHKVNGGYSIADIFETMDLQEFALLLVKESDNKISLSETLNKENAKLIKAFLNRHWDEILDSYYDEKEEYAKYMASKVFGSKNPLIIDSGWMGSGAIMLGRRLEYMGIKSRGMLIGTLSAHSPEQDAVDALLDSGKLVSYCFSSAHNRELWKMHDASKGHNLIVELLLSSDKPSFRAFKKDGNGEYSFNKSSERIDSIKVQEGILDFVKLFMKHMGDEITISGRDAFYPVTVLYRNKKWVESVLEESGININVE